MAVEQDIIRLLFAMTTLRGIFETFYAGQSPPRSPQELGERLSGLFPSIEHVTIAEASRTMFNVFGSGAALEGFIAERQQQAGSFWPVPGELPADSPFSHVVGGTGAPNVTGLTVPGGSFGDRIYEARYSVGIRTRLGTRDDITLTSLVIVTPGGTYADFLDELKKQVEEHANKYDYTVDTLPSGDPDLSRVDIIWGAKL